MPNQRSIATESHSPTGAEVFSASGTLRNSTPMPTEMTVIRVSDDMVPARRMLSTLHATFGAAWRGPGAPIARPLTEEGKPATKLHSQECGDEEGLVADLRDEDERKGCGEARLGEELPDAGDGARVGVHASECGRNASDERDAHGPLQPGGGAAGAGGIGGAAARSRRGEPPPLAATPCCRWADKARMWLPATASHPSGGPSAAASAERASTTRAPRGPRARGEGTSAALQGEEVGISARIMRASGLGDAREVVGLPAMSAPVDRGARTACMVTQPRFRDYSANTQGQRPSNAGSRLDGTGRCSGAARPRLRVTQRVWEEQRNEGQPIRAGTDGRRQSGRAGFDVRDVVS